MADDRQRIFGFSFKKKSSDKQTSFVVPQDDSGSNDITSSLASGFFGADNYSESKTGQSENGWIHQYRQVALLPEVDHAIEDIVNESIVADDITGQAVEINVSSDDYSDDVKELIRTEFDNVLKLLNFNAQGHEIFRNWYIDGRIFYHKIIDINKSKKGILELRPINPTEIKKIREIIKTKDDTGVEVVTGIEEYYTYKAETSMDVIKISPDAITQVTSGLIDRTSSTVLSYLHKAIRPANQLRMTENAQVIYRLTRAPERRIFYIDVGNMPGQKAEQYLKSQMDKYRNKMVYDASTGELSNESDKMSMLEDFWLPRREGGKGTEITTLPGGSNLDSIEDIQYFQKKLYKSLNVPISRLDPESTVSFGSSQEVTRDELRFSRTISKLRRKFSNIFDDILKTQLMLKGIISVGEWDKLKEFITYEFSDDNHYTELKDSEVLRTRLSTLSDIRDYTGKYFSVEWVQRNVLKQNEEDIKELKVQIEKEKEIARAEAKKYPDEDEDQGSRW